MPCTNKWLVVGKNTEVGNLHPSAELAAEAGNLIGIDYPTKPAAPDDLERLIQEILHKPGSER
jgi:hypothetical protein